MAHMRAFVQTCLQARVRPSPRACTRDCIRHAVHAARSYTRMRTRRKKHTHSQWHKHRQSTGVSTLRGGNNCGMFLFRAPSISVEPSPAGIVPCTMLLHMGHMHDPFMACCTSVWSPCWKSNVSDITRHLESSSVCRQYWTTTEHDEHVPWLGRRTMCNRVEQCVIHRKKAAVLKQPSIHATPMQLH